MYVQAAEEVEVLNDMWTMFFRIKKTVFNKVYNSRYPILHTRPLNHTTVLVLKNNRYFIYRRKWVAAMLNYCCVTLNEYYLSDNHDEIYILYRKNTKYNGDQMVIFCNCPQTNTSN